MRQHSPLCDSQLGPEFVVKDGEVVMTLHICAGFECLENDKPPRLTTSSAEASEGPSGAVRWMVQPGRGPSAGATMRA